MQVDPITVEVIGSALSSITEEMGEALVRASYSTNIKERRDCSTALFDIARQHAVPGRAHPDASRQLHRHPPAHPASATRGGDAARATCSSATTPTRAAARICPTSCWPSRSSSTAASSPGRSTSAHHADFADRGHAHIYQEGLRIPPIRLYRAGELQSDVQELILLNCQVPRERLSDLRAQMAANRLGVQRMTALCAKYGRDTVLAAGDALQDYAERKMRAGIAAIPDGTYRFTDRFDSPEIDGELDFSVEITVAGDEMRAAFREPAAGPRRLNMVYTALLVDRLLRRQDRGRPDHPAERRPGAPAARSRRPEGTVLNCEHPAAVERPAAACQRVVDLIHGAWPQAVPERVIAACNGAVHVGHLHRAPSRRTAALWVYLETIGGGSGARATKDGLDGVHVHMTNTSNLPVRGAGARISADPAALRAGGRLRRAGHLSRRHGTAPRLSRRGGMPRARRRRAPALAALGPGRRPAGRQGGIPLQRGNGTVPRWGSADCVEATWSKSSRLAPAATVRRRSATRSLVERDVREGRIDPELAAQDLRSRPMTKTARRCPMLSRRSFLLANAAIPFLRIKAFAAASGSLVFGLSSHPPNLDPWANTGTAAGGGQATDLPRPNLVRTGRTNAR